MVLLQVVLELDEALLHDLDLQEDLRQLLQLVGLDGIGRCLVQLVRPLFQPCDPAFRSLSLEELVLEALQGLINLFFLLPVKDAQGVPQDLQVVIGLIHGEEDRVVGFRGLLPQDIEGFSAFEL